MEVCPTLLHDFTVQFGNGSHCHQGGHIRDAHFVPIGLIPTNSYEPSLLSWETCVDLEIESSLCLAVYGQHTLLNFILLVITGYPTFMK